MRLCRFIQGGAEHAGLYLDDVIVPLDMAAALYSEATGINLVLPPDNELVQYLPPSGPHFAAAHEVAAWVDGHPDAVRAKGLSTDEVELRAPIPRPNKLFLLAGNYAAHIQESGGNAVERAQTFPYVFMKPISTTINHPGAQVVIPAVSPDHVDWEAELGVVIGKEAKGVSEAEALGYVAGYTVVNDISDRKYRPNPGRQERPKDGFFDWLHGKWHDGFCPMGPCVISADAVPDPQDFHLTLKVNGDTKQDASTALQIYPVAAVVAFISSWVTLEPGDIISTGTPAGVGNTTGDYLKPGDTVEAAIDGIGILRNHMVSA